MRTFFGITLSAEQVSFWTKRFSNTRLPMAAVGEFQESFNVSLFQAFWTYKELASI